MIIFSSASFLISIAILHVFGREVLDVEQLRQLAGDDDLGDALDQLRLVDHVGHAVDVDGLGRARLRADVPGAAQRAPSPTRSCRSPSALRREFRIWPPVGKSGPFDPAAQLRGAELVVVEQLDERRADLAEVVRRNVGGHADGDAGRRR